MTATATKKKPRSRSRNFAADWDDGDIPTPQSAIDGIADELELPGDFPVAVIEAAEAAPSDVSEDEFRGRRDLTQTPLITMDGEDARDFDDAIFAEKINGGFRLVVAIADVSRYITTGGILDKEAMRRGNSVYLPDRVLPMLPLPYSAGICSLVPNEIRLCMCAEMEINGEGEIVRYRFFQGVMKSHRRLTYEKAAEMLEDSAAEKKTPGAAVAAKIAVRFAGFISNSGRCAHSAGRAGFGNSGNKADDKKRKGDGADENSPHNSASHCRGMHARRQHLRRRLFGKIEDAVLV